MITSKFKLRTIAQKLCLAIGLATTAILIATAWICVYQSQRSLEEQSDAKAMQMLQATGKQLDTYIQSCGAITNAVAARQELIGDGPDLNAPKYFNQLLKDTPPTSTFD